MFKGSITALITPMLEDGALDTKTLQNFVAWQIKQGTHGLVPVGTTGESPTLSHEEHNLVVKLTIEAAEGKVPVIAGAGSNSTREAITLAQSGQDAGANGLLIVSPYYNKPSQEGLYQHFKAVHDASDLPIILYNIPGRSVVDISVETMARIAALPRIVGVKDATGDLAKVATQRDACGEDFIQLSGEDATAVGFNAMGGTGCISVTSNVAPALCAEMQSACLSGDYALALTLQDKLIKLHEAIFMEPSPSPVKYAASRLGLVQNRSRLPVTPMSEAGMATMNGLLADLNLPTADY